MRFLIRSFMKILDNGINQEIIPTPDGKIILKMNKVYGVVGILSLFASLSVIVLGLINNSLLSKDAIYILVIFALFFLLGLLLVMYTRNIMVEVTSEKIFYTGLSGKNKEIQWNQLKSISFNPSSKEIILKSNQVSIKLHIHLKGIGSLIKIIEQNVDLSIYGQAFKKMGIS